MKYSRKEFDIIVNEISKEIFIDKCKLMENNYIRKRKISPKDLILYELNKKGLSTKMEILNFNDINNVKEISSVGLFKQREKLNPEAFTYLIQLLLKEFYKNYKKEVKTYKGYVLTAIDGSDFEIPNTKANRNKYNGKQQNHCARITVSTCFDILNHYTLDTIVEKYDYSETKMAEKHYRTINNENILGNFKSIRIMDRNYRNLGNIYSYIKNNDKFIMRIASSVYEKEQLAMKTNDEMIEIGYEYNRIRYYKSTYPEVYEHLSNGNTIKLRCVKVVLNTGEIESLITNLTEEEFTYDEIAELYNLRWQIEINYKHLKSNLKIECISSGKDTLIKQDIYSQVLVANMLQSFINENDEKINQEKYKNKMKTNKNMSIGIFKNTLIYILLEKNATKRTEMMNKFSEALEKYIIPIKPKRINKRENNPKNKYHLNQRKTF